MLAAALIRAVGGERLHLRFNVGSHYRVEIVERPADHLSAGDADELVSACRRVAVACLGGQSLNYGLFAPDRRAWHRSVITLVRDRHDKRPIAFNAMPLLPVLR